VTMESMEERTLNVEDIEFSMLSMSLHALHG
jgi:hypothetical protein